MLVNLKLSQQLNDVIVMYHRKFWHFSAQARVQPAFTCSLLTIETLEQGVKFVQS